jgi:hypothetical protein
MSWFPEAGMARMLTPSYAAYVGTSKGGVIKIFDRPRGRLAYSDCGYIGRLRNGKHVSSQFLDRSRNVDVRTDAISVTGRLTTFARPTMTPWSFAAFRAFTLTVGRIGAVAGWLKRLLVRVLIYRRNDLPVTVDRTIEFGEDDVIIRDRLEGDGSAIARLARSGQFATIHMGSSRYFAANDLHYQDPPKMPVSLESLPEGVDLEHRIQMA